MTTIAKARVDGRQAHIVIDAPSERPHVDIASKVCEDARDTVLAGYPAQGKRSPELWRYQWDSPLLYVLDIDGGADIAERAPAIRAFVRSEGLVTPIASMLSDSGCPKFICGPVYEPLEYENPVTQAVHSVDVEVMTAFEAACLLAAQIGAHFGGIQAMEVHRRFAQPREFTDESSGSFASRLASSGVEDRRRIDRSPYWHPHRAPIGSGDLQLRREALGGEFEIGEKLPHRHCPNGSRSDGDKQVVQVWAQGVTCVRCGGAEQAAFFAYESFDGVRSTRPKPRHQVDWWFTLYHAARNLVHWSQVRFYFLPLLGYGLRDLRRAQKLFPERSGHKGEPCREAAYRALVKGIHLERRIAFNAELEPEWSPMVVNIEKADQNCVYVRGRGLLNPDGTRRESKGRDIPAMFRGAKPKKTNRQGLPNGWEQAQPSELQRSWMREADSGRYLIAYPDGPFKGLPMGLAAVQSTRAVPLLDTDEREPVMFRSDDPDGVAASLPARCSDEDALSVWDDLDEAFPGYNTLLMRVCLAAAAFTAARKRICYTVATGRAGLGKTSQVKIASRALGASDVGFQDPLSAEQFFSTSNQREQITFSYLAWGPPLIHIDECHLYHGNWAPVSDWEGQRNPTVKLSQKFDRAGSLPVSGPVIITGLNPVGDLCGASMASRAAHISLSGAEVRSDGVMVAALRALFDAGPRGGCVGASSVPVLDRMFTWACIMAETFRDEPELTWKRFLISEYGALELSTPAQAHEVIRFFELLAKSYRARGESKAPIELVDNDRYSVSRNFYSLGSSTELWQALGPKLAGMLGAPDGYEVAFEIMSARRGGNARAVDRHFVRFALHKAGHPRKGADGWLDLSGLAPIDGLKALEMCSNLSVLEHEEKDEKGRRGHDSF